MLTYLVAAALVVLVAVVAARRSRRNFDWAGDAFRCWFRACGAAPARWPWLRHRWSRPRLGRWEDGVLMVRRGPVLARTISLQASVPVTGVYLLPAYDTRRHGPAIAVGLRLADGSRVEVGAAEESRMALVGSYLAAAINDLPRAPVPRRQV